MRYRSTLVFSATIIIVMLAGCGDDGPSFRRLDPSLVTDEVLREIAHDVGTIVHGPEDAVIRVEGVQPARSRGRRLALVAPPPSAVEYAVDVPSDAVLRLGTAVAASSNGDGSDVQGGVRFLARVNGEVLWDRVWDPTVRRPARRHWLDVEIDLGRFAGREIRLSLETEPTSESKVTDMPAWSRVQLVQRSVASRQSSTPDAPNVVLLVVDTLRADRVGAYGAIPSRTPNLDAVATDGTVFLDAWAQAPWTLPSVASLLTGRYPRSHGVIGRSMDFGRPAGATGGGGNWAYLPDAVPTIASVARRAGITTFGVTSNLLVSQENNLAHGFETFVELPVAPMPIQWARAETVHRSFEEWLGLNGDWRFFAYLHYMEPHDPYVPTPELRRGCPGGFREDVCTGVIRDLARERERGGTALDPAVVSHLETLYDGEVRAWDAQIPRLMELLERRRLRDRTIVVVTSDHGEEFDEHGHLGHRKQLYAESLAVPLIFFGPGIPAGVRSDLVELIDVFPTVATLLGAAGTDLDRPGRDLFGRGVARRQVFAETRYGVGPAGVHSLEVLGVRTGDWVYMRAPAIDHERLYHVASDPKEKTDRSNDQPLIATAMRRDIDEWQARNEPPATQGSEEVPITDRLRALGYVE